VLINNASSMGPTPLPYLLDYPLQDFREVMETNLVAPFLLIKKVLPAMIESGGSIVNVTSDAGRVGYPDGELTPSLNLVLKECLLHGQPSWKEVLCESTGSIPVT
jgi:NAD(P)-dependent dehydrogenase (short-subunit alcohol dehydrogenase family)